jgi:hypothetical protein
MITLTIKEAAILANLSHQFPNPDLEHWRRLYARLGPEGKMLADDMMVRGTKLWSRKRWKRTKNSNGSSVRIEPV